MMQELIEVLRYPFMQNTLYAIVLSCIACGIVGTLVVCNRLTFLAGGAAHAAYGGIGIAFHWRLPVLPCTLAFAVAASLLMGVVSLRQKKGKSSAVNHDAAIGVLWAAGMAFGIILIEMTPGYAGELMGFLFGSILAVPSGDIQLMLAFDVLLCIVFALFHQSIWAATIDRDFSRARGLPVDALYLLIIALTAATVVILIRIVGLILVMALLTIGPSMAKKFCKNLWSTMALSVVFSLIFCVVGLAVSWQADISTGACIIVVATVAFCLVHLPLSSRINKA